jgi:hypothetical protein
MSGNFVIDDHILCREGAHALHYHLQLSCYVFNYLFGCNGWLVQFSRYVHAWPEYKEVPHGSIYGYGTARGMAKLYGILANGGKLGGCVLLSSATLPKLNEVVISGIDRILGIGTQRGYGMVITGLSQVIL